MTSDGSVRHCGICFFGKPEGQYEGIPICRECLSHRMELTDDMFLPRPKDGPVYIDIPKMRPDSEWRWWKREARRRAYEMFAEILEGRL